METAEYSILIVDDSVVVRELLTERLQYDGFNVQSVTNGRSALKIINEYPFDVILLDIMMPKMNGFEVLTHLKTTPNLRHLPVIMMSSMDDQAGIIKCIRLGAEDYLIKPLDTILLKARIDACLVRKQWRDKEQAYLARIKTEQERSDRLLLNILPPLIAERLKKGEQTIADSFDKATVLFADIVDFTRYASQLQPAEILYTLNQIFSAFDQLVSKYQLEKIKTIGDAYMVVGGVPQKRADHAQAVAEMALEMRQIVAQHKANGKPFQIRIGINTGPVVAGVIGRKKFSYDLWGDTVNVASRMEELGKPNTIHITDKTYRQLQAHYQFSKRGLIPVKGKGKMRTYFLTGRK